VSLKTSEVFKESMTFVMTPNLTDGTFADARFLVK